ncbi:hypothetical protein [Armatimonas sp.]|uniref:hypothetical protein n=1 Tax=Armatimonas sp. TaxID=1872638 RepID=UPI0037539DFC
MENNTQPKTLTRGGFLTALVLSVTSAVGILQGCSGSSSPTHRSEYVGTWETRATNSVGLVLFFTLSGYSARTPVNHSGEWSLGSDGKLTLTGRNSDSTPVSFTMTVTTINDTTLEVELPDGTNVEYTKVAVAGPTPTPTPTPIPTPTPTPIPTPTPRPIIKKVFAFTGRVQSFLVPAGVTSVTVKMWGAGGASAGGSGAFVSGTLAVTPGETLDFYVGQGGLSAPLGTTSLAAFGNGGTGTSPFTTGGAHQSGGGGGHTVIARGTTDVVVVGAGGGGSESVGGGGGLATGLSNPIGLNEGQGGTQSAGGAGRGTGQPGGSLFGGNGGGGGGGAGYFGGGGGGTPSSPGGGGGGSSLTTPLTSFVGATGANGGSISTAPGGAADSDYVAGVGVGGAYNQPGGNGYVVISYLG